MQSLAGTGQQALPRQQAGRVLQSFAGFCRLGGMDLGQELEEPCKRHLGEAGLARLTHFFVYFFGPITHIARGLPCCTEDVCNSSDCPTFFVCTPCTLGQIQAAQASYKLSAASGFGTPCAWRQTAMKHEPSKNFRGGIFFPKSCS